MKHDPEQYPREHVIHEPDNDPARRVQVVILAGDRSTTHAVPWDHEVVLGSGAESDIRIDDPSIESMHARLRVADPILLEDLGSQAGTYVGQSRLRVSDPVPVAFYESLRIGAVSIVLQPRSSPAPTRRIRSHDYFEGRLAEECARAKRHAGTFVLLRIHGHPIESDRVVGETIARMLRATDILCTYAPGDFEVLLADAYPEGASGLVTAITARCADHGIQVQITATSFPHGGTEPDRLLAAMRVRASQPNLHDPVIVRADAMKLVYELAARVAKGSISVLLLGETGVGKEVVAEAIHELSPRARKPLVRLSCVALSESLLESELFGHEKGAFTGAHQAKAGLLESADGGSVFLDEVAEMPASTQAKLLRVIERREIIRVGSVTARSVDVRFIAATNRDLEVEVQRGTFRQDLYYRLNGVTVVIPPLRERQAEIEPLAEMFVARACSEAGRAALALSPAVREFLRSYSWPGNVRELRNVMSRAVLLCSGTTIEPAHLPLEKMRELPAGNEAPVRSSSRDSVPPLTKWNRSDDAAEHAASRERIRELLERCGGNQHEVARVLGISRRTLMNWMDRYGLARPRKRRQ